MPESEKKEESAESREEAKEQVGKIPYPGYLILDDLGACIVSIWCRAKLFYCFQERLKAAEAKRIEKERTEKYNKLKEDAKGERAKMREKVVLIFQRFYQRKTVY